MYHRENYTHEHTPEAWTLLCLLIAFVFLFVQGVHVVTWSLPVRHTVPVLARVMLLSTRTAKDAVNAMM